MNMRDPLSIASVTASSVVDVPLGEGVGVGVGVGAHLMTFDSLYQRVPLNVVPSVERDSLPAVVHEATVVDFTSWSPVLHIVP